MQIWNQFNMIEKEEHDSRVFTDPTMIPDSFSIARLT